MPKAHPGELNYGSGRHRQLAASSAASIFEQLTGTKAQRTFPYKNIGQYVPGHDGRHGCRSAFQWLPNVLAPLNKRRRDRARRSPAGIACRLCPTRRPTIEAGAAGLSSGRLVRHAGAARHPEGTSWRASNREMAAAGRRTRWCAQRFEQQGAGRQGGLARGGDQVRVRRDREVARQSSTKAGIPQIK